MLEYFTSTDVTLRRVTGWCSAIYRTGGYTTFYEENKYFLMAVLG